ncbi:hypothetical protein SCMU_35100 [Sinomonas cyclohexanicum]|uniref:Tetratricopeptide repeat protein n=1 Tax=Sinomonas cyclohexanicum TaxID=322009 RepID=A0ABM7PZC9_SINCY|nr:hypothetical protein [Corynebacterium cyclohexanicum]BCT77668.1 hypothetical protein SCMU_35100 [Corynebacterium cyclohexanicum]
MDFTDWFNLIADWAAKIGETGLAVIGMVAVAYCLYFILIRGKVGKRSFSLGDIAEPAGLEGTGAVVQSLVLEELRSAGKGPHTLKMVDGPDAAIPAAAAFLPEQWAWLGPLLASRSRRLNIDLTPVAKSEGRIGLDVRLSDRKGREVESVSLAQPAGTDVESYASLATKAGAWLAFMVTKHSAGRRQQRHRVRLLGTEKWESYADFRCAQRCSGEEKRQWLDSALAKDHRNVGALVELGRELARHVDDDHEMAEGIRHLRIARRLLEPRYHFRSSLPWERGGASVDPLWYQTTYSLAVAHYNRYLVHRARASDPEGMAEHDLRESLALSLKLSKAVGATQLTFKSPWRRFAIRRRSSETLRGTLDREYDDLATLVAGPLASWEMRPTGHGGRPVVRPAEKGWAALTPSRLDVLWELLADLPDNPDGRLPSALSVLNIHTLARPVRSVADSENAEWDDDPLELVGLRARYQRSCVLMELGRYEEAVDDLEGALEHVSAVDCGEEGLGGRWLLEWVRKDPALALLWVGHSPLHRDAELAQARRRFQSAIRDKRDRITHAAAPISAGGQRPLTQNEKGSWAIRESLERTVSLDLPAAPP